MRISKWTAAALLGAAVLVGLPALPAATTQAAEVQSQVYTGNIVKGVNLRAKPSTSSNIITLLKAGEKLTNVTASGSYWYKVTTSKGVTGYVSSSSNYIEVKPVVSISPVSSNQTGVIVSGVNLRSKPSTSSSVIRLLNTGESIKIIGSPSSYWYQIQTASGEKGYISSSSQYVELQSTSSTPDSAPQVKVPTGTIVSGVNFRTEPSTSGNVIRLLKTGETVQVLEAPTSSWYKIKTSEGQTGYISSSSKYIKVSGDLPSGSNPGSSNNSSNNNSNNSSSNNSSGSTLSQDQLIQKVFEVGKSYLGTPYEYGSDRSTTTTFDCSDFTRTVYREATGVILPADSRQQGDWVKTNSTPVYDINSLKPGDLMFFMNYQGSSDAAYADVNKSQARITHVGIYMGNGQIMHTYSVSSGGVRIDTLSASWKNRFLFGGSVL